jgi:beta-glucosidase
MPTDTELDRVLGELTLEQKIGLLTGADFWALHPIPEIGLRRLQLSDGPSGVRGAGWDERETSLLFPNPSALAATWDAGRARRAGELIGRQAREMGVAWLLAPNVNLHRSPLGGRHFEGYSEDPLLTSVIAEAFVAGVQSQGVAATPKHFIGNESETDRMTYDALISEKTLREVYLPPFEAAVSAGAWSVMVGYNSVNGASLTDNRRLLTEILKEELGFDGVLVSDWTAARSTTVSANAGLDLVMPGPGGPWGDALLAAVRAGDVAEGVIDDKVRRILRLAARTGFLAGYEAPDVPQAPDDDADQLRDLAARAMVVLRNEGGLLPLDPGVLSRVAVIGPNAALLTTQGGGSAHVNPPHVVSPLAGLAEAFGPNVVIDYAPGVVTPRLLPPIGTATARDPETNQAGLRVDYLSADGDTLGSELRTASRLIFLGGLPAGTAEIRMRVDLILEEAGEHQFSVSGAGVYALRIGDSAAVAISLADSANDPVEALVKPPEHRVTAELAAGIVPIELRMSIDPTRPMAVLGLNHEGPRPTDDELFAAAVAAARAADVAVVFVGTTAEVESEGFDRTDLLLPGRQDELVAAVLAANSRTIVVVNAGAPVEMPWRADAPAILWTWLPGQEGGSAIADVLTGAVEPGGRLPTTFPAVAADAPVLSTRPVDGTIEYSEGSAFGYRGYAAAGTAPAFPFGHGLGYTTWEYEHVRVRITDPENGVVNVTVRVRNTGSRTGREVVQVYLGGESGVDELPPRLVGFDTVLAAPGEIGTALVQIDRRTLARWDGDAGGWHVAGGPKTLLIGRSATDVRSTTQVTVQEGAG